MKKTIRILALAVTLLMGAAITQPPKQVYAEQTLRCKAAYLCDSMTGTVVLEQQAQKRLPIASMCKIMTLLLCFEAIQRGEISNQDSICMSERAAGMGGSQVFLQAGDSYVVEELLKSIVVCSANDSCVAMAEHICGEEQEFVARMNERAKQLDAENTLFANCTGLPKDPQYSCAHDVALMLRELLRHERFFTYAGIHLENFQHPDGRVTQMTNTNRLMRMYEACDGGKTGFTQEAGFCLAATAHKADTRLIGVVIGADSSQIRFDDMKTLFERAFAAYETKILVQEGKPITTKLCVRGSRQKQIGIYPQQTISLFLKKGEKPQTHLEVTLQEAKAPIQKGDLVGELIVYRDNMEYGRTPLCAMQNASRFSWKDAFQEGAANW